MKRNEEQSRDEIEEQETEEQEEERLLLTREDVLARLRECWEEADLKKGALTPAGKELIELNLTLCRIWTEVQESNDITDGGNVIGFHYDESEDGEDDYDEGDFPDEGDEVYNQKEVKSE